ncbi:S1 RNA-binding domain-containing protein [Candidatus Sumerlaeota bacterium]|nr:S1 RNA-binding domain-containing protein [Candidatus Sumerlaeota bacterium]
MDPQNPDPTHRLEKSETPADAGTGDLTTEANPAEASAPTAPQSDADPPSPAAPPAGIESPTAGAESGDSVEDEMSDEEFDKMLAEYDQLGEVGTGDLVLGTIVSITGDSVLVDLGDKTEGVVPLDEFKDSAGNLTNAVGDRVDVLVLRRDGDTGQVTASRRKAVVQAALAQLDAALAGGDPLTGRVIKMVKNGVIVDLGIECFMPASHLDIRRVGDLEPWVGREVEVLVLELHRGRRRAVVSRRAWLERRQTEEREKFFSQFSVGEEIRGRVKNITDFGVFVDLGGFDGLVPRDELSWERGLSPADVCGLGEEISVKIQAMNPETGKITLSRKRTLPDPWETAVERLHVGEVVSGVVVNVTSYGAFVRVEEGLTGLIHTSDLSWSTGRRKATEFVSIGDQIKAQVLEIDGSKRRLSLGLKQITADPWAEIEAEFPVGTKIRGKVTSVTGFGLFIEIREGIEGLVHQSDLSWERKGTDPKSVAQVGEEIEVVVLKIDRVNRKISLGHKQLSESPYVSFIKSNPVGSHCSGKVTRVVSFGAFVELAEGVEGLIHISHLDEGRVEKVEDVLKPGDEVTIKILKADPRQEKITLSRRAYLRDIERREIAQYTRSGSTHGGANLGEALKLAGLKLSPSKGGGDAEPGGAEGGESKGDSES